MATPEYTPQPFPNHCKFVDLTGRKIGRLVVQFYIGKSNWLCKCKCGNTYTSDTYSLRTFHTKSCGCLKIDRETKLVNKFRREYSSWKHMRRRCYDENNPNYDSYGARGIGVCKRWYKSFKNFLDDMGTKPSKKHSIDRIDNEGSYNRHNCRWATPTEQSRNTRRNRQVTCHGETKCIAEWCEVSGQSWVTISRRLDRGWNPEDAVFLPKKNSRKGCKDRFKRKSPKRPAS